MSRPSNALRSATSFTSAVALVSLVALGVACGGSVVTPGGSTTDAGADGETTHDSGADTATDVTPDVSEEIATHCDSTSCGGPPPSHCLDGSTPILSCDRQGDGSCGWTVTCPTPVPDASDASDAEETIAHACGGLTPPGVPGCPTGTFCNIPISNICGAADGGGTCDPIPGGCSDIYAPVCGCDGKTYGNACAAAQASMSVKSNGECGGVAGASCGGFAGKPCEPALSCVQIKGVCTGADIPGNCMDLNACTTGDAPVCGCDGKNYSNICAASKAGVAVDHDGPCTK